MERNKILEKLCYFVESHWIDFVRRLDPTTVLIFQQDKWKLHPIYNAYGELNTPYSYIQTLRSILYVRTPEAAAVVSFDNLDPRSARVAHVDYQFYNQRNPKLLEWDVIWPVLENCRSCLRTGKAASKQFSSSLFRKPNERFLAELIRLNYFLDSSLVKSEEYRH